MTPEVAKAAMKNSKYALLKPEANLTDLQRSKLAEVKAVSPQLAAMHQLKEDLRVLFKHPHSPQQATLGFLDEIAAAQRLFQHSVGTMTRWFGKFFSTSSIERPVVSLKASTTS